MAQAENAMGHDASKTGQIVGLLHPGISVSDLGRSLRFYRDELGLQVLYERDASEEYLREMHGLPFTVVRLAFLAIPNCHSVLELLEYRGVETRKPTYIPMDPSTGHICFLVDDIHGLFARLREAGRTFRSMGPVEITVGPNQGSWAVYAEDPDGYPVEFIQWPAGRSSHGERTAYG